MRIISKWKGHNDQVWVAAFDHYNHNLIYSGSDDYNCYFAKWDLRASNKSNIIDGNDEHKMGVCSIVDNPNINQSNYLLTGSYDEYLRLWDKRSMKRPIDQMRFKDGVWRVKWNQNKYLNDYILIASMRDGFHILKMTNDHKLQLLTSYHQHDVKISQKKTDIEKNNQVSSNKQIENIYKDMDILAYGCDWKPTSLQLKETCVDQLVATCSFYDKQFHVWNTNLTIPSID